ncbi:MAG: F0F1 ATP synthase subunit alpha [Candidatus Levybacteria bacterium RIFCSPHIGHO2_02_FULL_40_18]|nr:MAG: F0F1 ATP synthase subunit alpha [Candidatus Levybacteria bacterium RIFCSPHIGHO2_01_FULL_40_58]OGH27107.1 MAG: F0F1 ATP synthase subunit alpha [Candidatus Levybacteria bacterium RIFCSPHIGHO2_02_FULL_40_18]OGH30966.1 MAG: F0F1 ATP synthase subunit alpha [Candidatus Levybacteria bacterium RIFCSPHIGHO2_12_FULL_40_31]OGH40977.1 MAG: F0F1 ATP synthase subunit alpha [Candidatus Levybacteria bacterium RIFCSPLOWO2_01_FULL_40_64]OGH48946.1 MAG: F0F1 ATP synthase subunit alpha [Candidatus Levybact
MARKKNNIQEFLKELELRIEGMDIIPKETNEGRILTIGDGIVTANGLSKAGFGEEVEFEDSPRGEAGKTRGLVFNLDEDRVSIILLKDSDSLYEGMKVKTTGKTLGINVSDKLLGRVINSLGDPLDGKPLKKEGQFYPLEKIAPGVIERQPVDTPLKTGIKAIDSMIPIGRGQRELIIGDRNTGKTAIALDTIINQTKRDLNLAQVICIYCAIGQKRGNIARILARLFEEDASSFSIVVAASASDSAAQQFLAPFTATAIAEYFMDKGKDVLVVYDDLSKHAWAYRQISLLLRRPAGREAYPGDIFYLHSRLLERSARMSGKEGGGSITSFPIIETQAGDVASYIPTNVISITDGQIYLETDLFNAGTRPAINAGLSVSRVGGAAQTGIMKQVSGPLRLDLAQFRSLAAFVQFGSDLDEQTQKQLERGRRVAEILKQPQFTPLDEAQEVISIFAASRGLLDDLAISKIRDFETKVHDFIKVKNKKLWAKISSKEKMDDKTMKELSNEIENFKKSFK